MLVFVMACNAMGATWPVAVRRLAEATLATLPLLALLFLPIALFGLDSLYPWTQPERVTHPEARHLLEHKLGYFRLPFFFGRAVVYFGVWTFAGFVLRRWSLRGDETRHDPRAARAQRVWSAVLLPAVGLTLTFAAFDWLMSLSPDWFSTMYGVYFFAGGFLGALALLTVLVAAARRAGYLARVGRAHGYALGRLLFAFVVFWAYIAYFQYFLVWIADRPVEARWFLERVHGPHRPASVFLAVGHFVLPFFYLLPYGTKQRASLLVPAAVWLLAAHYVDVHWLVAPARHDGLALHWLDAAALVAVSGWAVAFAVWRQRGHLLAPVHDPAYERALEYESA
jgi:hypothetical protein